MSLGPVYFRFEMHYAHTCVAKFEAWLMYLMASHGITLHSADLVSSAQLNSDAVMHHHTKITKTQNALHANVDGIHGSAGLRQVLTFENMQWRVMLQKVQRGL